MERLLLLVDKPKGITSHDVVNRIRKITKIKKVGHAGTLDPNATGLLVIGIGRRSTKLLGDISKNTVKEYKAKIFLGAQTSTDDSEGQITQRARGVLPPGIGEIKKILKSFLGENFQIPPYYSAVKIKGIKSYELARRGVKFSLKPRKVHIYKIDILSYKFPYLDIETRVSSGTYIRSLARDIGNKLGIGAFLEDLERIRVGEYGIDKSVKLNYLDSGNWEKFIIPHEQ